MHQNEEERLQIAGTVQTVTFYNPDNGFAVFVLLRDDGEETTVVGAMASPAPGESLLLSGKYIQHRTYGQQFEADGCEYYLPETPEDVLMYLSSGAIPGIGPVTAKRIVEQFGGAALEILASRPAELGAVKGMTAERAKSAQRHFLDMYAMREAVSALCGMGLTAAEGIAVWRRYGKDTLDLVAQNPYVLCDAPLYISFSRADAIARPEDAEQAATQQRVGAAVVYTLRRNMVNNGHICLPLEKLVPAVADFLAQPQQLVEATVLWAQEAGQLHLCHSGERQFVYLPEALYAEKETALALQHLAALPVADGTDIDGRIARREKETGMQYAPLQKTAIAEALRHGALVITGGPGTGKTTAVNAIIALHEQNHERVLLAAPTGRAAKRMAELTGRSASTIHRLLEVEFTGAEEFPRFKRNEKNPLRCDVLVVDEMSMVDIFLFRSLLAALRDGCRLVMVGDADQLPSVGAGNVLKGIIASDMVPVVRLSEIFRQAESSLIVKNAHRIVAGQQPQPGTKKDDWFFLPARGTACQQLVCQLAAQRLPQSYGYSPLFDIQVLCPGHNGPLGTIALNAQLQELLNPPAKNKPQLRFGNTTFRLGDKVMQTKNDYDIPYTRDDGEDGTGAFNGDIGVIEHINPPAGTMTVLCDDRHVEYSMNALPNLELAYAVTIHKSQGSEFEAVIIPLCEVPWQLQYRNLLYTGVTRAKQLCILAGEEEILQNMVNAGRRNQRYSCLAAMLRGEVAYEE